MSELLQTVDSEITRLVAGLLRDQEENGSWRYCFENGTGIDAYMIILLRALGAGHEELIRGLHDRIAAAQQADGCWRLYADEQEGNLSATIEAYYALLYSGYSSRQDEALVQAERYITAKGGLQAARSILTKVILAATGQRKWPWAITSIPLEVVLLPDSFPVSMFDFSGYSRIHLIPMLIMAHRRFSLRTAGMPDLRELAGRDGNGEEKEEEELPEAHLTALRQLGSGLNRILGATDRLNRSANRKAEQFLLDRIEGDGTLYSYASSTVLLVFALLALGYDKEHPVITRAVEGLIAMSHKSADGHTTIQNSPSTVWDTALLSYALQEAGLSGGHPAVIRANAYLLNRQHSRTGDWSVHNPDTPAGGWGFSESNTLNPDVDDTTAALRALGSPGGLGCGESLDRGLNWVLSMQNEDGGWPAFEKNTDKTMLTWLAIEGAKSAAIDPSEADLTGRTLEYLGNFCGLGTRHPFIKRGCDWLIRHQEEDGSWYGRWGVCYLYGTWAGLTGLSAAGIPIGHETVRRGASFLLKTQNKDGGWGESCQSDQVRRYVHLGESTASQTAWALDALIAVEPQPTGAIDRGITRLIALLKEGNGLGDYPTGAGLPGYFYSHYHSYSVIWPLLTLAHFRKKYGGAAAQSG